MQLFVKRRIAVVHKTHCAALFVFSFYVRISRCSTENRRTTDGKDEHLHALTEFSHNFFPEHSVKLQFFEQLFGTRFNAALSNNLKTRHAPQNESENWLRQSFTPNNCQKNSELVPEPWCCLLVLQSSTNVLKTPFQPFPFLSDGEITKLFKVFGFFANFSAETPAFWQVYQMAAICKTLQLGSCVIWSTIYRKMIKSTGDVKFHRFISELQEHRIMSNCVTSNEWQFLEC